MSYKPSVAEDMPYEIPYELPTTPSEVIKEELRVYPDVFTMKECIARLTEIYGNSTFGRACTRAAYIVQLAHNQAEMRTVAPGVRSRSFDAEFHAGTVLGTHAMLYCLDKIESRTARNHDPLGLENTEAYGDKGPQAMEQAVDRLSEFRAAGWLESFDKFALTLQERVLEVGYVMFDDSRLPAPDSGYAVDTFAAGFTYAVDGINDGLFIAHANRSF